MRLPITLGAKSLLLLHLFTLRLRRKATVVNRAKLWAWVCVLLLYLCVLELEEEGSLRASRLELSTSSNVPRDAAQYRKIFWVRQQCAHRKQNMIMQIAAVVIVFRFPLGVRSIFTV